MPHLLKAEGGGHILNLYFKDVWFHLQFTEILFGSLKFCFVSS